MFYCLFILVALGLCCRAGLALAALRCERGFPPCWPLPMPSAGLGAGASAAPAQGRGSAAHGPSLGSAARALRSEARGTFRGRRSNPRPQHWQLSLTRCAPREAPGFFTGGRPRRPGTLHTEPPGPHYPSQGLGRLISNLRPCLSGTCWRKL